MRNSKQRELIRDLIKNRCDHPTAEMIYMSAREKNPNISLGTVYRILNNLVEKGKIRSIKTMDDIHHYDNINHKHDHFICVKCGLIEDVDKMNEDIKTINCNHVLDCDITYKGICKKCI